MTDWAERWARIGYTAAGVVYLIIGWMAILVAWHGRGRIVGTEGAIEVIGTQPYGRVLLGLVALGLAGYAFWRVWTAISDADGDGTEWKGLVTRAAILCSGIGYGALGLFAARRALVGSARSGQGRHLTAILMQRSWGVWLIGLVGVVLMGAACVEAYYAISERYRERLRVHEMASRDRAWLLRFGKWGYLAQAVVLAVAGWFLLRATLTSWGTPPVEGLDGALRIVARQEYGTWLLGIVSTGLAAYGAFMLVQARYRRLR